MKALKKTCAAFASLTCLALLSITLPARASDAETSASATGGRASSGTAAATARYEGDVGFARTDTRTGKVNLARGVAVGVDENGVSLSVSLAVAPQRGPALATNFNLTFNRDGSAAVSTGRSVANGGTARAVTAGGRASATPAGTMATSMAGGNTSRGGVVRVQTRSEHYEAREILPRRIIRIR